MIFLNKRLLFKMNNYFTNVFIRGDKRLENKKDRSVLIYERLKAQTWEEFDLIRKDKKIFLFGAGKSIDYFFQHYNYKLAVEGILDNDSEKWGGPVSAYTYEDITFFCYFPCIQSPEILDQYYNDNIVFMISSTRYYVEIATQLQEKGFADFFSLFFLMEKEKQNVKSKNTEEKFIVECSKLPLERKKMIFYTMGGYSGHGKRIAELLLQYRHDLDIVWVTRRQELKVPRGIRLIRYDNKKRFVLEMETAGYWIFDDNIADHLIKREGQCYIQLKHWPSITLKSFGRDLTKFRQEKYGSAEDTISFYNGEIIDYAMVGSQFDEETFRKAFAYEGKVVYVGSPRSDILFHREKYRRKICNIYHLEEKTHILLYAPTFRIEKAISGFQQNYKDTKIDLSMLFMILNRCFGGTWIIFLRLHPNVAFRSRKIKRPSFVIDVSDYGDGEELVAASDLMITDYSSIMFEPAFVKKPVFLYAPDRYEYINQERELLIDYDTLPFDIAESNEELCDKISRFDQEQYERRLDNFFKKYGVKEDGHAGERAVDFILKLLEENE